jgi:hypothetical protein
MTGKAICRRLHRKQPKSDSLLFSGYYEEWAIAFEGLMRCREARATGFNSSLSLPLANRQRPS